MSHHTHKARSYFPRDKKRDRDVNSKGGRHNNRRRWSLREEARKVRHTAAKQINEGINDYLDTLQNTTEYCYYEDYDQYEDDYDYDFYDYDPDRYNCYDSRYDYIDDSCYDYVNNYTVFNDVIGAKFVEEYVKTVAA